MAELPKDSILLHIEHYRALLKEIKILKSHIGRCEVMIDRMTHDFSELESKYQKLLTSCKTM